MNVIIIFIIIGLLIWCRYLHKNVELLTDAETPNEEQSEEDTIARYIGYLGKYVPEGGTGLDFSNVVGIQGPTGERGHPGERGQDGVKGDVGAKGDTGSTITSGKSRVLIDGGVESLLKGFELIDKIDKIKINEGFTQDDEDNISSLVFFNTYINTYLLDYIYTNPAGATGAVGAAGKDGVKGDIGATGKDGAKGATGAKGIKGDDGFDGSSIFDVSKFRLNGDTDLFKKRRKKDDDSDEPQPSTAYTTLFD